MLSGAAEQFTLMKTSIYCAANETVSLSVSDESYLLF